MLTGQVDGGWVPARQRLRTAEVERCRSAVLRGQHHGHLRDRRQLDRSAGRQAGPPGAVDGHRPRRRGQDRGAGLRGGRSTSLVSRTTWSGIPGADVDSINADLPKYDYDVAAAKALAKEAGVNGQELVIATTPAAQSADVIAAAVAPGCQGHRPEADDQDGLPGQLRRAVRRPGRAQGRRPVHDELVHLPGRPDGVLRDAPHRPVQQLRRLVQQGLRRRGRKGAHAAARRPGADRQHHQGRPDRDRGAALAAALQRAHQRLDGQAGSPASSPRSPSCTTRGPRRSAPSDGPPPSERQPRPRALPQSRAVAGRAARCRASSAARRSSPWSTRSARSSTTRRTRACA